MFVLGIGCIIYDERKTKPLVSHRCFSVFVIENVTYGSFVPSVFQHLWQTLEHSLGTWFSTPSAFPFFHGVGCQRLQHCWVAPEQWHRRRNHVVQYWALCPMAGDNRVLVATRELHSTGVGPCTRQVPGHQQARSQNQGGSFSMEMSYV